MDPKTESATSTEEGDGPHKRQKGLKYGSNSSSNPPSKNDEYPNDAAKERVILKRRVGLLSGVALIVGNMIGSGIFVSPGQLLNRTGSVSVGLIVWVACGLLSSLGALAYAELGGVIPKNGGEFVYLLESMRDLHPVLGPLPGFLFVWVTSILLRPSSQAILTLTFSRYLLYPIWNGLTDVDLDNPDCADVDLWSYKITAAACACLVAFVNCYNVRLATRVQNFFTAAKLIAIVIIVIGGIYKMSQGNYGNLKPDFENTGEVGQIATAFYSGLWAYDGWNNMNYITEEIENPFVNLPRAIMIAVPLVTLCYTLVNIAYLTVMTAGEIIASKAVAVTFGEKVLGKAAFIMPLAVAFSTFGAANASAFTVGRLTYSAAKEGHMVDVMSYVQVKSLSPAPAIIFNAMLAVVMIMMGDIGDLIDFVSFTSWIFYGLAMVSLIILRRTRRDFKRPYKVNILVPITVALIAIYLVVGPIVADPRVEYLYALGFIFLGVLVYIPFVAHQYSLPGMKTITRWIQMLLQVVPTNNPDAHTGNP